jgi:hypothetical protein
MDNSWLPNVAGGDLAPLRVGILLEANVQELRQDVKDAWEQVGGHALQHRKSPEALARPSHRCPSRACP